MPAASPRNTLAFRRIKTNQHGECIAARHVQFTDTATKSQTTSSHRKDSSQDYHLLCDKDVASDVSQSYRSPVEGKTTNPKATSCV